MHQNGTQALTTMIIALLSCLSSFYLWIILFLRKREYHRTQHGSKPSNNTQPKSHKFSYTTSSTITIFTQFVYYMAIYQSILSLVLMLQSINEYRPFTEAQSCDWNNNLYDIFCIISKSIITFFLIGSISWYFMITITVCSSLFNRSSVSNIDSITKYHSMVLAISFCVTFSELYIAHQSGDYDFSNIKVCLFVYITLLPKIHNNKQQTTDKLANDYYRMHLSLRLFYGNCLHQMLLSILLCRRGSLPNDIVLVGLCNFVAVSECIQRVITSHCNELKRILH